MMLVTILGEARRQVKRMRRSRGAGLAVFALAMAALFVCGEREAARAQYAAPPKAPHALVISIDGYGARWYMAPPAGLKTPNLDRLRREGAFAEGVVGVYPSVTYPSHTTLVTGELPAQHGIYTNLSSREAGKNSRDWFWFTDAIKVPTLWDEVRRAGLTSAGVSWPVTVGAKIDWNLPEIWDPAVGGYFRLDVVRKHATPGLVDEGLAAIGPMASGTDEDTVRARFTAYLLKKYKPNLTLLHIADLDSAQHRHGPESAEAIAVLERADERVGELLASIRDAGLESSTTVFIVSDHGFLPIEREIRPNVLLAKAGLLEAGADGQVTGGKIFTLAEGGAFFITWPEGEDFRAQVDAALKPLRDAGAVWGVLSRQALDEVGAEPAVRLALEAPSGSTFSSRADGEMLVARESLGGTHGYLPYRPRLEAAFIAWGPNIRSGAKVRRIRMTAVAPTVLKSLGIENPEFGAHPPLDEIFK
jgi:predicted AlkP superfamily pyrophosphatase or phosphodiesterase